MVILIERFNDNGTQTLGCGEVIQGENLLFSFYTLELSYKNNQRYISSIPKGEYDCVLRYSVKFSWHFHILDVPNREYILIHSGNFHTDTLGCVLVGEDLGKINNDEQYDLLNSNKTMKKLLEIMPKRFKVIIKDEKTL